MRPIDADKLLDDLKCYRSFGGHLGKIIDSIYAQMKEAIDRQRTIEDSLAHWNVIGKCKLPPEEKEVIVTVVDCEGTDFGYTMAAYRCGDIWIANNGVIHGEVIAWKPMPGPYERGE